jgi:hypothetical protein
VTESGAEATAVQTLARGTSVLELREAFGLRRVYRRFVFAFQTAAFQTGLGHRVRLQFAMRLWTLHPKYLDARGLVALWREALLAQKVLRGATRGYKHHPQLRRFSGLANPPAALATYLAAVQEEAVRRGYKFNASKIGRRRIRGKMTETRGQLFYEWRHLKRKLRKRDVKRHRALLPVKNPGPHPLFRIVPGKVRDWEKVR